MPKYFDPVSKRPAVLLPAIDRITGQSTPSFTAHTARVRQSTVAPLRNDSGAGRAEKALRTSSHAFKKFQQATQTHPVESALSHVATDASITLRAAMACTSELLVQYQSLAKPGSAEHAGQAQQRATLSDDILKSVEFEFDCMDALTGALADLQRVDAAKLVVARDIASQAASQEAKFTPLLAKCELRSSDFQTARNKDASAAWQLIDRRTTQIAEQLRQAGILGPD